MFSLAHPLGKNVVWFHPWLHLLIADNLVPPWLVALILIGAAISYFPTQKLIPTQDLGESAVRDAKKKEQTAYNAISYNHSPIFTNRSELLNATKEIEALLGKV